MLLAQRQPVQALVLISPGLPRPIRPQPPAPLARLVPPIFRRELIGWAGAVDQIQRQQADLTVRDVMRVQHLMGAESGAARRQMLEGARVDREVLSAIPTLVIGGGMDRQFPEPESERLAEWLGAEYQPFGAHSHYGLVIGEDSYEQVADAIRGFLERYRLRGRGVHLGPTRRSSGGPIPSPGRKDRTKSTPAPGGHASSAPDPPSRHGRGVHRYTIGCIGTPSACAACLQAVRRHANTGLIGQLAERCSMGSRSRRHPAVSDAAFGSLQRPPWLLETEADEDTGPSAPGVGDGFRSVSFGERDLSTASLPRGKLTLDEPLRDEITNTR